MTDQEVIKGRVASIEKSGNPNASMQWAEWASKYGFDLDKADSYDIANANSVTSKLMKQYSIQEAVGHVFNRDDLNNLEAQLDMFVTAVLDKNISGELLGDASILLGKLENIVMELEDSDIGSDEMAKAEMGDNEDDYTIFDKDEEGTLSNDNPVYWKDELEKRTPTRGSKFTL